MLGVIITAPVMTSPSLNLSNLIIPVSFLLEVKITKLHVLVVNYKPEQEVVFTGLEKKKGDMKFFFPVTNEA